MQSPNQPIRTVLAQAQAAYTHANELLVVAEQAYARAFHLLREAQTNSQGPIPLPHHQRHFLCGHEQMEHTTEAGDQEFSLCPICRVTQEATPAHFTLERTLLIRAPLPNDPEALSQSAPSGRWT